MARPRKHSDDEILSVARAVFLEHGPAASFQRIAREVGLSQPALSQRFGSKEVLLVRAMTPSENLEWVGLLVTGPDERPLPDQLRGLCIGALAFFAVALPCLLTLRAAGLDLRAAVDTDPDPAPLRIRRATIGYFARARDRGLVRDTDPNRMATLFIGAVQARALEAHVLGEPFDDAVREGHATAIVDLLWNGVRP